MLKRYAFVGTGSRVTMFIHPIAERYRDVAQIVGFCDLSPTRMQYHLDTLKNEFGYENDPVFYGAAEFDRMIAEQKPDTVVICSIDATHAEYIIRSLRAGCDVVVEKPIAIDAAQCAAIQEAALKSDRKVRVTFNVRWSPGVTRVKELLEAGTIGVIQHVQMEYLLNTAHGADYFRRWHSSMAQSGGLLVHKSTHHFDLINWWIDSIPKTIFANGKLAFYGKENAVRRGDERFTTYERYTGSDTGGDPFAIDLNEKRRNILYYQAEKDDGYIRDRNVFRNDIDIYDTMSVLATYRNGVHLTYTLIAYSPCEGYRVCITGDRGRIEYSETLGTHLMMGQTEKELTRAQNAIPAGAKGRTLTVFPHFKDNYTVDIPTASGGHGGGDPLLQEQILSPSAPNDQWQRGAGWEQGIASAMLGICANKSIATGDRITLTDLIPLRPDATRLSELT